MQIEITGEAEMLVKAALASGLLMKYGQTVPIRTLDAIQTACAIDLRERGYADVLVTSDKHLLALAELDGSEVMNPEVASSD